MDEQDRVLSRRLRVTLALQKAGIDMMRQTLRRRHPEASDGDIDDLLRRWLTERPNDSPGVASHRFGV